MSNSKLDLKKLEARFDEILESFDKEKIDAWFRFNEEQLRNEAILKGKYLKTFSIDMEKSHLVNDYKASVEEIEEEYEWLKMAS